MHAVQIGFSSRQGVLRKNIASPRIWTLVWWSKNKPFHFQFSTLKRVAGRVLESRSKKAKKIQPPTTSSSEDDDSVAEVDDDLDLAGFSGNIFSQDGNRNNLCLFYKLSLVSLFLKSSIQM